MSAGEHIVRFTSAHAAQVALPHGKHALVESMQPMAVETSSGNRAPVDLGLTKAGDVFESVRPAVGVLIPAQLRSGVRLPESGISLTPVDAMGSPLSGSAGTIDGASVLYANTQASTDTVMKPTTAGVEADTILRSVDSPRQLYFHVGLPPGARLAQAQGTSGPMSVIEDGQTIAVVRSPSATDAVGMPVPVSMSAKGDLLALSVAAGSEEHQWPIAVDPEVVADKKTGPGEPKGGNWILEAKNAEKFGYHWNLGSGSLEMHNSGSNEEAGEYIQIYYATQGQSKIYKFEAEIFGSVAHGRARMELVHEGHYKGSVESSLLLAESTSAVSKNIENTKPTLCANAECATSAGVNGNIAAYLLETNEPAPLTYNLSSTFANATVWIAQEKAPELTFNESEGVIDEGRPNVLDGTHGTSGSEPWLSPSSGAFEVKAHDPGIGVSWAKIAIGSWSQEEPIYKEGNCLGVQCKQDYKTNITYNPAMPEGEQTIDWYARNLAGNGIWPEGELTGLTSHSTELVKIDAAPPSNIEVTGWPRNREISAASHSLTFEATDGKSPTNSSGIRSISVSVDGGQASQVPNVSCTLGPCTVSGKWTLNAEGLSEGVHRLVVTATDNANNTAAREIQFDVRHGSPTTAGPGTVDPTTGQLKLSATDVSLAGVGGVSRVYESRNLTAGSEGPLGPQWAISLGGGAGLTVLPNGSVVLASSAGNTTTFTRNEKGEFESPRGDGNLKIEAKEKVAGKGITEYLLVETLTGATTKFTQPPGTASTTPVYSNQFGVGEGGQLSGPVSDAFDSSGNLWVTDAHNNRIEKFSSAGLLLAAYGSYGSGRGQFIGPWGIAVNQANGNVYVVDQGNNRIEELNSSGGFEAMFGWGVADGKSQFEVCKSICQAGIAGSGLGQVNVAAGVAVDSSGNVWVADYGNNRIEEFGEEGKCLKTGECERTFTGEGTQHLKQPLNIAFSGTNLYVTDAGDNRVEEFSSAGVYLAQFGKEGTGNGEFKGPQGIAVDPGTGNLYVSDANNNRVQEVTPTGTFVAKFGSAGSGTSQFSDPAGVAVGSSGGVYVVDFNNNRVEEWTRPTWLPTLSEAPPKSTTTTFSYKAIEVEGKMVIQPTEALAPSPGIECGTTPAELKKGCRALTFYYPETTTAKGMAPSEWGEYKGHLSRVYFHGWDPLKGTKGEMSEPVVAQYEYDSKGRLRAEWDPRIVTTTPLKTTYGYDEEGHVVAVSPPGQEPWLVHYGTMAGDSSTGRLLSVTRPAASSPTVLKTEEAKGLPVKSSPPKLSSTSPVVGTTLSVSSEGIWTGSPLTYNYQWLRCTGTVCEQILGAVNQRHTPQVGDTGYTLEGQVAAVNSDGSSVAITTATSPVSIGTAPSYSLSFGKKGIGLGEPSSVGNIAVDASGNIWISDSGNNRLVEFSSAGTFLMSVGYGVTDGAEKFETCTSSCRAGISGTKPGQFAGPGAIAVNQSTGVIYVADKNNRVQELNSKGEFIRQFGSAGSGPGQFSFIGGLAIDAAGNVWAIDMNGNRIEKFSAAGSYLLQAGSPGTGEGQVNFLNTSSGIAVSGENIYVCDVGNSRIDEFASSGAFIRQWGKAGIKEGEFEVPSAIAKEPGSEDLYVSDSRNNRVQVFNPAGTYLYTFGSSGSGAGQFEWTGGIAFDSAGDAYVGDDLAFQIEKWKPNYSTNNPRPEPPSAGTNSITTIEYHLPLSGSGLPNLTESEVVKWGQKDDPTEAVADISAG